MLLAQGREEANRDEAQETYHEVQHHIVSGDRLELYSDVARLIPDGVSPICKEQIVEIEEYVREKPKAQRSRAAGTPRKASPSRKKKRSADPETNVPEGSSSVFIPASKLIEMAAMRNLKGMTFDDDASSESDGDDRDLEENLGGLRRATSYAGPIPTASKAKKPRNRNETNADGEQRKRISNSPAGNKTPGLQRNKMNVANGQVDQVLNEDDKTPEGGLLTVHPPSGSPFGIHSSSSSESPSRIPESPSLIRSPLSDNQSPLRIPSSPSPPRAISLDPLSPYPPPRDRSTDPDPLFPSGSSQPQTPDPEVARSPPASRSRSGEPSPLPSVSNSTTRPRGDRPLSLAIQRDVEGSMSSLVDGDEQNNGFTANDSIVELSSSPVHMKRRSSLGMADSDPDVGDAESLKIAGKQSTYTKFESVMASSSPQSVRTAMPPPPQPLCMSATDVTPEPTFPVRPKLAKRPAKRKAPTVEDDVDVFGSSPPVASLPRRLHQRRTRLKSPSPESPPRKRTKGVVQKREKPGRDETRMSMAPEWVASEAVHSGGEVSDGAISGAVDQSENEYDREFVNNSPSTPTSPSYNQMQIYRGSLLSQDPGNEGPLFARRPMRQKPFGNIDRRSPQFSSSPTRNPEEGLDEYERDSFIVSDDAEISCGLSSDP